MGDASVGNTGKDLVPVIRGAPGRERRRGTYVRRHLVGADMGVVVA